MSRGSSNKATERHFCRAVSPGLVLPQGRATSRWVQQRSHAHSLAVPQPHLDASTQQQELAPSCPTCRAFSPILLNVGSAGQASCFCRCRAGPGAAHRLLPRTLVIALNTPRGRCLLTLPSHLLALCAGAASSSGAARELGTALQSGAPRGSVCPSVGQGGDGGARPGYAAICGSGAGPRPGQDACGVGRDAAEQRAALRAELRWGRRSPSSSNPISALSPPSSRRGAGRVRAELLGPRPPQSGRARRTLPAVRAERRQRDGGGGGAGRDRAAREESGGGGRGGAGRAAATEVGPGVGAGSGARNGRSGRSEARCGGRWPRCCPARRGGRTRSGARGAGRPRASPLSPGSFQPAAEPLGTTVLHAAVDTRPQPLPGEGSGRAALSPPPTHPDPTDPVPARCLPSAVLRHRHHGARQLLPVRPGGAAGLASQQR